MGEEKNMGYEEEMGEIRGTDEEENAAISEALENRAEATAGEECACDSCGETVLFHMRDNTHNFTVSLTTVLQCLEFAVKEGALPKLPVKWCVEVQLGCGIGFDDDAVDYSENGKLFESLTGSCYNQE